MGDVAGYAGIVTTLAGAVGKFQGAAELEQASNDLILQGYLEAQSGIDAAEATARALRQRAAAGNQDISTLNALTDSNLRNIERQRASAEGQVIASAAGSGVTQAGSPLLAALTTNVEIGRAAGVQKLRQQYGVSRLQFEVEQNLAHAVDVQAAAQAEAMASLKLRGTQAETLRKKQLRTILSGVGDLTNPTTVKNAASLFSAKPSTVKYSSGLPNGGIE